MKQPVSYTAWPIHESDLSQGRNIFSTLYYLRRGACGLKLRGEKFSLLIPKDSVGWEKRIFQESEGMKVGWGGGTGWGWVNEKGGSWQYRGIFVFTRYRQRSFKIDWDIPAREYGSLVTKDFEFVHTPCQLKFLFTLQQPKIKRKAHKCRAPFSLW